MRELALEEMAWTCPEEWLPWGRLSEVEAATSIVGQERAVEAIAFGLAVRGIGYNVFVTGLAGTGRLTTIKRFLDRLADAERLPGDVCYVYNFRTPDQPNALVLRAGAGRRLVECMDRLVRELAENLPGMLSDKEFRQRVERAVSDLQQQERELVEAFQSEVQEAGFSLVNIQAGPVSRPEALPMVGDKPVSVDEVPKLVERGELSDDEGARLVEQYRLLTEKLQDVFQGVAELRRKVAQRVEEVRRTLLEPTFDELVERCRRTVGDEGADAYLEAVREDLRDNFELFVSEAEGEDPFIRWRVNLAVDNGGLQRRPVILESEPTYTNIFGTVERSLGNTGEVETSHMRIRAGSLMRANGGFLVLNADDVLLEPRVWPGLKRALKYRRAQIQSLENVVFGASLLKAEAVPLDVKVVVIGDRNIYDLLYRHDSDFSKVFKVLADFDSVMGCGKESAREILSVLRKVSLEEDLLDMDCSGMAAMLEEAVRMSRWHRRFSTRFSDLADLLRESAFRAEQAGAANIGREHVRAARLANQKRHSLTEDRTQDLISDGIIRVATEGTAVGQVNGLAVYDLGHHRFGKPSRITARVGLGREGVINIERQSGLSGPTHDKGVNILTGFLRGTFAKDVPLTMACSVTFEQSYGGIDGDSASSTEIYAILSALSGAPIRQDLAVTGSVDQYGDVQAIGGVNEKVEGFFRVCEGRGLSGTQGVMMPAANVADLHLDERVLRAVGDGRFHLYAVETISEGIELLTGRPAGVLIEGEGWSEDSIYGICQRRLEEMTLLMRRAGRGADKDGNDAAGGAGAPGEAHGE